jgi:biopolymer transport protein ExbD
MIFKQHVELQKGQLDVTPLIDVVFQLLIFFMLTSSFISPAGIRINLPSASSGKPMAKQNMIIFVTGDNKVMVDGKEVNTKGLKAKINTAAKVDSHILINADKGAQLGGVVEIWDLCREAGISNLNIATEKKTTEGGAL